MNVDQHAAALAMALEIRRGMTVWAADGFCGVVSWVDEDQLAALVDGHMCDPPDLAPDLTDELTYLGALRQYARRPDRCLVQVAMLWDRSDPARLAQLLRETAPPRERP